MFIHESLHAVAMPEETQHESPEQIFDQRATVFCVSNRIQLMLESRQPRVSQPPNVPRYIHSPHAAPKKISRTGNIRKHGKEGGRHCGVIN